MSKISGAEKKYAVVKETSEAGPTAYVVYLDGDDEKPGKPFATKAEADSYCAKKNGGAR